VRTTPSALACAMHLRSGGDILSRILSTTEPVRLAFYSFPSLCTRQGEGRTASRKDTRTQSASRPIGATWEKPSRVTFSSQPPSVGEAPGLVHASSWELALPLICRPYVEPPLLNLMMMTANGCAANARDGESQRVQLLGPIDWPI
jgi:hypothetical protein